VDQIIRDLVEAGIGMVKVARRKDVEAQAHLNAESRVLDALVGANASETTRESFRKKLRSNSLDDKEIEVQVADIGGAAFDIPGMPGSSASVINISDIMGKAFGNRTKTRRMTVKSSYELLIAEESDKLLDQDQINQEAIDASKTMASSSRRNRQDGARRNARGRCQPRRRAAIPAAIEGTTVSTKYGPVKPTMCSLPLARFISRSLPIYCRNCRAVCSIR
jgi:ATP-dependent HslUV protease ATP-binding subunit HslU